MLHSYWLIITMERMATLQWNLCAAAVRGGSTVYAKIILVKALHGGQKKKKKKYNEDISRLLWLRLGSRVRSQSSQLQ